VVALREWLLLRPRSEAPNLFLTPEGWPLTTEKARRLYHALGESAGVPQAIPHRARHTAASEFLSAAPGAEHALRSRLGHLSVDVLADYVSISDPTARKFAELGSLSARWAL
jgi:site-specific recombinase XerD